MTVAEGYILVYGDPPFSNFAKCIIEWEGETFSSVEQLYQFRKEIEFGDSAREMQWKISLSGVKLAWKNTYRYKR